MFSADRKILFASFGLPLDELTLYSARLLMTQDKTASRPSGIVTFRMDSEKCGPAVVTVEDDMLPSERITDPMGLR